MNDNTDEKVVPLFGGKLPPQPEVKDEDYRPAIPGPEVFERLSHGKPLTTVVVITCNEANQISYFADGVAPLELVGLLETIKAYAIAANMQ